MTNFDTKQEDWDAYHEGRKERRGGEMLEKTYRSGDIVNVHKRLSCISCPLMRIFFFLFFSVFCIRGVNEMLL